MARSISNRLRHTLATFPPGECLQAMTETEKEPPRPPGTTDAVRGATTTGRVRYILAISIVLVIIAFVIAYMLA